MNLPIFCQFISPESLLKFDKVLESLSYHRSVHLVYKGHIPFYAFILKEGALTFKKGKKELRLFEPCTVFLNEFEQAKKSEFDIIIDRDSEIMIIDRSSLSTYKKCLNE